MFEIGEAWTCKSFGLNWVCHHYISPNSPPAFIFATARLASPSEKLEWDPFEIKESSPSLVSPAKKVSINKQIWIDSFHQNSFYKNVLSRYERTLCCDNLPEKFQVLVGFHAFKDNYPRYAGVFLKAIRSLSLLTSNLEEIRRLLRKQNPQQTQEMNDYIQNILFENNPELSPVKKQKSFSYFFLLLLFVSFLLLGAFYYKKRKAKKAPRWKKET